MTAAQPLPGSAAIPEATGSLPPTGRDEIERSVGDLVARKDAWLLVGIPERVALLDALTRTTLEVAPRWVQAAGEAKRIPGGSQAIAEEWLAGPFCVVRNLRLLREALLDIARVGHPVLPAAPWTRPDGQVVAPVFPASGFDRLLYKGFSGEIWMDPSVTLESLPDTQAVAYKTKATSGKVALVLGAGNVASIGVMDAFYKLFVEDQVVILKMNPVNAYLAPFYAEAFRALIQDGFLRIVSGGAAEGSHLCGHPAVDEIHITGSDKTHDAIVFGTGAEGARRKANRQPQNTKRITSELGNVSPVIVVPGPWKEGDLAFQGANLASMLTNNGGFNCNAVRVIVTHRQWGQREALLGAVKQVLRRIPPRAAYYPGARERWQAFVDTHRQAEQIGEAAQGSLPWTLVEGLSEQRTGDICFTTEAFCSVAAEVPLGAPGVVEFVDRAVEFCNSSLWGTLNAAIVVHPKTLADPKVAEAVEQAIAGLRYGSICVNHWPAISYVLASTTWGAFPGHDIYDIQSGMGVVHNTYLFDRPQKSVVRGPFIVKPTPPWFVTHKTCAKLAPKLTRFEAGPSFWKLPGILWQALRG
jgi:hypothetical protein